MSVRIRLSHFFAQSNKLIIFRLLMDAYVGLNKESFSHNFETPLQLHFCLYKIDWHYSISVKLGTLGVSVDTFSTLLKILLWST